MTGTYTQIYIHAVWHVNGRDKLSPEWRSDLFKYMGGIIRNKGQKPIIVNGVSNHVHLLFGIKPSVAISDILREIKNNSTNFLKEHRLVSDEFAWQTGFSAFSVSTGHVDTLYKYILNQENHHKTVSFKDEYRKLLQEYDIEFKEEYLFDDLDDIE